MEEEMQAIVPEEALPPAANGYKPSHPDLFRVKFVTGSYASSLIAIKVRPSRSSGVVRLKGAVVLPGVQTRRDPFLPRPCDPDNDAVILYCPMGSPTRGQPRAKFRSPLR